MILGANSFIETRKSISGRQNSGNGYVSKRDGFTHTINDGHAAVYCDNVIPITVGGASRGPSWSDRVASIMELYVNADMSLFHVNVAPSHHCSLVPWFRSIE
jgi:hypothetical protein